MAVSLNPVNAKLTVDLGFDKQNVELSRDLAFFNFVTGIVCTGTCIAGGWLAEWIGRRRFIALCVVGTAAVTLGLAWILRSYEWVMPLEKPLPDSSLPVAPPDLVRWFWIASIAYSIFQGLMYGVRNALFMDVCTPAVAATQFTAYMALLNLTIAYSNGWQGWCCTRWGFPAMLVIDAAAGLVCLALLPMMSRRDVGLPETEPEERPVPAGS
jgi:PAT family beta-lactamase induction signal transducer AmpG